MRNDTSRLARSILDALLDQLEQPDRRRVVRVRLNERRHPEYFFANDFSVRRDAHTVLQQLADQGFLRLRWRKWEEGNWLDSVDLVEDGAQAIYSLVGRTPLNEQESALRRLLASQSPAVGWRREFLQWADRQLDMRLSVAPLRLSAGPGDVRWNRDLLAALQAITDLREPALERKFSVQVFGDSKRFDDLRQAVIKVLRRHDLESELYGDDDRALLRARLLERAPEYVPLAGPLALGIEGRSINLGNFVPSVAVPATILNHAAVNCCDAEAVATVENLTSFSEFAVAKRAAVLAVYTGGFASPSVIGLLQAIRGLRPELPFLHWGDLDAGGLRILAHLRKYVRDIKPLAMDAATFQLYRKHAQSLNANEREALTQLREHPALVDCVELIEQLLESNQKLEQEAVAVDALSIAMKAGD